MGVIFNGVIRKYGNNEEEDKENGENVKRWFFSLLLWCVLFWNHKNNTAETFINTFPSGKCAMNTLRHIGIILDGNRRFAKRLMAKPWKGHEWGVAKVENVLKWCQETNIKEVTLWGFSYENFNRPEDEKKFLFEIFTKEFNRMLHDERLMTEGVKVNFIGRLHMFPQELQDAMEQLRKKTENNSMFIVNFALAYGGRAEIVDAARKMAEDLRHGKISPEDITLETFDRYLYMKDDVDLIIRTGGEKRSSGFVLWQGAYAEWIFLEKMWPEFEKEDLLSCLEEFKKRERKFGE